MTVKELKEELREVSEKELERIISALSMLSSYSMLGEALPNLDTVLYTALSISCVTEEEEQK